MDRNGILNVTCFPFLLFTANGLPLLFSIPAFVLDYVKMNIGHASFSFRPFHALLFSLLYHCIFFFFLEAFVSWTQGFFLITSSLFWRIFAALFIFSLSFSLYFLTFLEFFFFNEKNKPLNSLMLKMKFWFTHLKISLMAFSSWKLKKKKNL